MNNNIKRCDNCYFGGSCKSDKICEYYAPINDQPTDKEIDDIIEENRVKFRTEWFKYAKP